MHKAIEVFVPGRPAPQGSKRHVGRGILIESSKAVGPWRERVDILSRKLMKDAGFGVFTGPVEVRAEFVMPRPKSAPKTRTPAATKRPDLDKLLRAALDAISGPVIADDSQVISIDATKRLAGLEEPSGLWLRVTEVE